MWKSDDVLGHINAESQYFTQHCIYIYMCVCVCVCVYFNLNQTNRWMTWTCLTGLDTEQYLLTSFLEDKGGTWNRMNINVTDQPSSHSDHYHLSFNSNHLHLINTRLSQHYLSTHLISVSCLILLIRSGLTRSLHLLTSRLLTSCSSCLLRLPVFVRHPSSSSVLVRGMCSPTSSTSSWQENHHLYIL